MSKIIGVDTANIDNISSIGVGGSGSYDPVTDTGTYTETVPSSGLLRIGGIRSDQQPGYYYGPTPVVNFSSDKDGLYLSAQVTSSYNFTKIAVWGLNMTSENATYAINDSGELWGIGSTSTYVAPTSSWGQITQAGIPDTGWTDIAAGSNVFIGINSGKLYYIGAQTYAGAGGTLYTYSTITQVGVDTDWVAVSCGANHSLAIKGVDNKVYSTGSNSGGKTGLNTTSGNTISWTLVDATNLDNATNENITYINANNEGSLIIQNGKAFFFGQNRYDQNMGLSTGAYSIPVQIGKYNGTFKTDWSKGYGGNYSSHLIDTSGKLWWTGANNYGSAGNGTTTNNSTGNYLQIGSDTDWQDIQANKISFSTHNDAVAKKNGKMYWWGRNDYGNIIDSSLDTITTPTLLRSGAASAVHPSLGSGPFYVIGSFA